MTHPRALVTGRRRCTPLVEDQNGVVSPHDAVDFFQCWWASVAAGEEIPRKGELRVDSVRVDGCSHHNAVVRQVLEESGEFVDVHHAGDVRQSELVVAVVPVILDSIIQWLDYHFAFAGGQFLHFAVPRVWILEGSVRRRSGIPIPSHVIASIFVSKKKWIDLRSSL